VHREHPRIREKGGALAFVGNGGRHFAKAFARDHGITAPVYVDTERRAYQALEMKRGLGSARGVLASLGHAARAWRAGFRQGATQGDALQLGGVLVVRPGGRVAYRHVSAEAGDHPPLDDVLAAL